MRVQVQEQEESGHLAQVPLVPAARLSPAGRSPAPGPRHWGVQGSRSQPWGLGGSRPRLFGVFSRKCCSGCLFACIYGLLSNYDRVFRTRTGSPCPELRAWARGRAAAAEVAAGERPWVEPLEAGAGAARLGRPAC